MIQQVYLDYNATTPTHPIVLARIQELFGETLGNPSNDTHSFGRRSRDLLEGARSDIASELGASDYKIVFTASSTEAIGLVLNSWRVDPIFVGATEHKAVLETSRAVGRNGGSQVERIAVDPDGLVRLPELVKMGRRCGSRSLVCIQAANGETGVLQPVADVLATCASIDALSLVDASQAVGKISFELDDVRPDFVVLSSHKLEGPAGIACLLIRESTASGLVRPMVHGGGQEWGLRPGTENVLGAVGFALAVQVVSQRRHEFEAVVRDLVFPIETFLNENGRFFRVHGRGAPRLPNTISFAVLGRPFQESVEAMPRLAFSAGAACNSRESGPSGVLRAMGVSVADALSTVRFSFGRSSRSSDLDVILSQLSNLAEG
jgi:cysteine desulfurase